MSPSDKSLSITVQPLQPAEQAEQRALVTLWNESAPPDLPISTKLVNYCLTSSSQIAVFGEWAVVQGQRVGVAVASALSPANTIGNVATKVGWIEILAVHPDYQRQGVGTTLLQHMEHWLAEQGCRSIAIGGSLRPFFPGVPVALNTVAFFQRFDFTVQQSVWDVAMNLATYTPPEIVRPIEGLVRPAQEIDHSYLDEFLQREFPGRWHQGFQQMMASAPMRLADYMVLWTERGIDGFCRLTFADSPRPIEQFYPYQLPRPWGQLGPIGVSADRRGMGFGAAVLDAGLRRLHNNGVNGCIIDWTTLIEFYGAFGFQPHREYKPLTKLL